MIDFLSCANIEKLKGFDEKIILYFASQITNE